MQVVHKPGPGQERLKNALKNISNKVGKVGWIKSKQYEEGTEVATVAAQNEFGNPGKNIPPRPFMRPTIAQQKPRWMNLAASGAKAIMAGNETSDTVLEKIAAQAAGDIKETISRLVDPPLSPVTIAARLRKRGLLSSGLHKNLMSGNLTEKNTSFIGGLTKPLVDTGQMLQSLTYAVEKE